jgi:outer membrane immunogenic protein
MKTLLGAALSVAIAGTAFAADMPVRNNYYTAPATFSPSSWAGPYIGGQIGYEWGSVSNNPTRPNGFQGGVEAGYNWQFGQFVVGLEGDGTFGDVSSTATVNGVTATAKVDSFSTFRGRAGVAVDQVLFYGTAGLALADTKITTPTLSGSNTQTGWTAGAGVEWMFAPHWSLKGEYLYRSFDNVTVAGVSTGTLNVNSGQVGINYHF